MPALFRLGVLVPKLIVHVRFSSMTFLSIRKERNALPLMLAMLAPLDTSAGAGKLLFGVVLFPVFYFFVLRKLDVICAPVPAERSQTFDK